MSDEKFRAINPVALYQIATYINPNGTNEEIFNTMKELREIQHKEGRFDINNKELLDSLKDRLNNEKRLIKHYNRSKQSCFCIKYLQFTI